MALWQFALIALVVAWAAQSYGVWLQTRHYQKTFGELRALWSDGVMGAGAAPAKLGRGAIALVVASPDRTIRAVRVMQGRSVLAKFTDYPEFEGLELEPIIQRAHQVLGPAASQAIAKAIEQIEKIRDRDTVTIPVPLSNPRVETTTRVQEGGV